MNALTSARRGETAPWTAQDRCRFWFYQAGGYVVLNLLDEPAWLALMFC